MSNAKAFCLELDPAGNSAKGKKRRIHVVKSEGRFQKGLGGGGGRGKEVFRNCSSVVFQAGGARPGERSSKERRGRRV